MLFKCSEHINATRFNHIPTLKHMNTLKLERGLHNSGNKGNYRGTWEYRIRACTVKHFLKNDIEFESSAAPEHVPTRFICHDDYSIHIVPTDRLQIKKKVWALYRPGATPYTTLCRQVGQTKPK